ncbi:hypothetical protein [Bordetella genomosp. 13]|uniref:hypothetical protein n=1 Tax=Bordetella genomosp. 13 TaxID=463040 RepID=UPI0011A9FF6E|nr:hypothetical protein [Bordetella genomosp. 13]
MKISRSTANRLNSPVDAITSAYASSAMVIRGTDGGTGIDLRIHCCLDPAREGQYDYSVELDATDIHTLLRCLSADMGSLQPQFRDSLSSAAPQLYRLLGAAAAWQNK